MSDKALAFEDFVLDDYDFNVYTDWDLMDLWEWVEMDDFSDLQGGGGGYAPPPQSHAPPPAAPPPPSQAPPPPAAGRPAPSSNKVDQIMSDTGGASDNGMNDMDIQPDVAGMMDELGLNMPDMASQGMTPHDAADISNDLLAGVTAPSHDFASDFNSEFGNDATSDFDQEFDFNEDFDFGTDFENDPLDTTDTTPHHDTITQAELPQAPARGQSAESQSKALSTAQPAYNMSAPAPAAAQNAPKDMSFADQPSDMEHSYNDENHAQGGHQGGGHQGEPEDDDDDDFDFDFDFDEDDDAPIATPPSPPPPPAEQATAPTETIETAEEDDEEDFDFDFDFDEDDDDMEASSEADVTSETSYSDDDADGDDDSDDDFDFDFSFDDGDTEFQDFETSDSLDLDMTSETDNLDEDDFDFDFEAEDDGFGTGGYASESTASPAEQSLDTLTADGHPRYIETTAGIMDIETDNILSFLQQLEFDEFLETLQLHGHVYDKIMSSDEWSQEEVEFLRSIEPLVKDEEKIAQIREQKEKEAEEAKHRMPDISGYEDKDPSHYDPRACASLQDMQNLLKEKALDSNLGQKKTVTHMPKKLVAEWSKDTVQKKTARVGKNFSRKLKPAQDKQQKPWLKYVPHLPTIKTGKHERYYDELSTITQTELHAMCSNLDKDSINFIKEDGQRFGTQFTEFLLSKYGTKILFLYRSQMENDILADKMFEDFHDLFSKNLKLHEPEDYTQDFFRAILDQMQIHNIKI